MIITKNLSNEIDDQILTYHKVIDCIISNKTNDVVFVVGSWVSQVYENDKPQAKTNIAVHYDLWSYEYYDAGAQTVMDHPDWHENGPARPDPTFIWNPLTLSWVPPSELPLDDLKIEKWKEIKIARNTAEFGGFVWNGFAFDSTQISVIRISAQVQSAIISKMTQTPYSINWKLKDNSIITLTSDDMIAVSLALSSHVTFCHNKSTSLHTQLDLAGSSLQISEVNW